ncbi:MAG: hypothetical protein Q4E65_05340 [Clostridia bacterium]|nr:hypothetical protein [Clostridia bacterium]
MDHIEMVEKLRQKANVSYEEAKAALERNNWDLLDAMIELEKQGRINADAATYDTASETRNETYQPVNATASAKEKNSGWNNFKLWCAALFKKIWLNAFVVTSKAGEKMIEAPILILIVLALFCFWVLIPLMVIGLFFGLRYSFTGPDIKAEEVNRAMSKATDVAEGIKEDIKSSVEEEKAKNNNQ